MSAETSNLTKAQRDHLREQIRDLGHSKFLPDFVDVETSDLTFNDLRALLDAAEERAAAIAILRDEAKPFITSSDVDQGLASCLRVLLRRLREYDAAHRRATGGW